MSRKLFAFTATTALFVSLAFVAPAATHVHASGRPGPNLLPGGGTPVCMTLSPVGTVTGSNSYNLALKIGNPCGFTMYNTFAQIYVTEQCGSGQSASQSSPPLYPQMPNNSQGTVNVGGKGTCVSCTNGVVTGYPPFSLTFLMTAYGVDGKNYSWASNTPNQFTLNLPNSPSAGGTCS